MITNIFIPEVIGSYYVFSKRIVAFYMSQNDVYAAVVEARGTQRTLKQIVHEPIRQDATESLGERTAVALQKVVQAVGTWDRAFLAVPSNFVIYQSMTFPFKDYATIAGVIRYEIEPLLPVSSDATVLGFIVTRAKDKEGEVLAAVVPLITLEELQVPLYQNGVSPARITVDMFEVFGLYKERIGHTQTSPTVALIHLDYAATHLAYVHNGDLIALRSLSIGVIPPDNTGASLEQAIRFGITPEAPGLSEHMSKMSQNILFSLQTMAQQAGVKELPPLNVFGPGALLEGVIPALHTHLQVPVSLFDYTLLKQDATVTIQTHGELIAPALVAVATALGSATTASVNLKDTQEERGSLLNKQLLAAALLTVGSFFFLFATIIINTKHAQAKLKQAEIEALARLKKTFTIPPDRKNLTDALTAAQAVLNKEENVWFALSNKNRYSFLNYLQELSTLIDRQGVGLNLKKLSISEDSITLEGSVRDFNALITLRNELERSQLFVLEALPQSIDFTTKPLRLIIRKP